MSERLVVGELAGVAVALPWDEFQAARARAEALLARPAAMPPAPPPSIADTDLLTPDECAVRSGTSRTWWIRKARRGEIPSTRVGRHVRFTLAQLRFALGQGADLDPGIAHAVRGPKFQPKQVLVSSRNSRVTAIVRARRNADRPEEGGRP